MEGIGALDIENVLPVKAPRDALAKRAPVAVLDPPTGTDERKPPPGDSKSSLRS